MDISISEIADSYEKATSYFENLVSSLSAADLDIKAPGEWSARQIIHHMADSEAQSYARLRRLLAEPEGSIIQGYDEGAWANSPLLGYAELAIENSLTVTLSVRAASLDLIRRLSPSDLERFGSHSERGKFTVRDWLNAYSGHPLDHGSQLERAIKGLA
jgi:hypothetical protein